MRDWWDYAGNDSNNGNYGNADGDHVDSDDDDIHSDDDDVGCEGAGFGGIGRIMQVGWERIGLTTMMMI